MSKPTAREVIKALGGNARIAVALGLASSTVLGWANSNRIPPRHREALRGLATASAAIVDQGTVAPDVPEPIENVADFIRDLGGVRCVALSMGLNFQNVYMWTRNNHVPAKHRQKLLDLASRKGLTVAA